MVKWLASLTRDSKIERSIPNEITCVISLAGTVDEVTPL